MIKIIQITDPHLLENKSELFRDVKPYETLKAIISNIKKSNWDFDIVIATGDLAQDNKKNSYNHFVDLLTSLNTPIYSIPGNHDDKGIMQSVLTKPLFHYCNELIMHNWLIIGIDSNKKDSPSGYISQEEFNRLRSSIESSDVEYIMIYLHHQPINVNSRWIDAIGLENKVELYNILDNCNKIKGLFFGHTHQSIEMNYKDIQLIGTPSTCRQFKPNSDSFAMDNLPPAYRKIQLNNNGSIDTNVVWLNY